MTYNISSCRCKGSEKVSLLHVIIKRFSCWCSYGFNAKKDRKEVQHGGAVYVYRLNPSPNEYNDILST